MSNSSTRPTKLKNEGGYLLNTRKVQVVLVRRGGGEFALGPHARIYGVRPEDFASLPNGVRFVG